MRKAKKVYSAKLPVTLEGEGCVMCPSLRIRWADNTRTCNEVGGTLENWKTERSPRCPLIDIVEKKSITSTTEEE